jgi:hypothetical protein
MFRISRAVSLITTANILVGCSALPSSAPREEAYDPAGKVIELSAKTALLACMPGLMFGLVGCAVTGALGAVLGAFGGIQNEMRKAEASSAAASPPSSDRPTPK